MRTRTNLDVDPDLDYTPFTIVGPTHPNLPGRRRRDHHALQPEREQARRGEQRPDAGPTEQHARLQRLRGQHQRAAGPRLRVRRHHHRADGDRQLRRSRRTRTRTTCRFCKQTSRRSGPSTRRPARYRLPYDIQLAGSFQARPGIPMGADYTVTPAVAGRAADCAASATITVNLADPTQLVLRLRVHERHAPSRASSGSASERVRAFMEVFNLVNDSTIYTRNETFARTPHRTSGTTRSTWSNRGGSSSGSSSTSNGLQASDSRLPGLQASGSGSGA